MDERGAENTIRCRLCGGPVPLTEKGLAADPHRRRISRRLKRQGAHAVGNGGYCKNCGRLHVYDERINLVLTPLDRKLLLKGTELVKAAQATISAVRPESPDDARLVDRLRAIIDEIAAESASSSDAESSSEGGAA